jgi:hypothetical protein
LGLVRVRVRPRSVPGAPRGTCPGRDRVAAVVIVARLSGGTVVASED